MKKYKEIIITSIVILSSIVMPIRAYAAQAVSNININFTEPTLNGEYKAITLDNLEITDGAATSLKDAVVQFNVSCTTNVNGAIVGCSNYNTPAIYSFSIDIGLNTSIAYFQ